MHGDRMSRRRALLLATLLAVLGGCSKTPASQQDLDGLDKELADTGNQGDPTLIAALRDQIMVDSALTQSANANTVRPPVRLDPGAIPPVAANAPADRVTAAGLKPVPAAQGDCPACRTAEGALTLGELARRQSPSIAACAAAVSYSATWANRLPAELPLYPDARVREAAGNDGCGLRVVSFASSAPFGRLLDWYYARVTRAGFSAGHQADGTRHVLGGTRGGMAYALYVTPDPAGGSDVDLVVN